MFNVLTPLPGTKLAERLEKEGKIFNRDWANYHTGTVVINPVSMTADELQNGYYWIYRECYSWPNILKRVFRSPKNLINRAALNYSYRRKVMKLPEPQIAF
jgi:hypothetical protein